MTDEIFYSKSSQEYKIKVNVGDVLSVELFNSGYGWNNYAYLSLYLDDKLVKSLDQSISGQPISYVLPIFESKTIILKAEFPLLNRKDSYKINAGIRNLALNNPLVNIGSNGGKPLFSDCKLNEVLIERKLKYNTSSEKGYSPFYRNTSLRKVTIADSETEIYDNEFYGCSNLQEFKCGDGITKIGNWAFSGCSALKSYMSGASVKDIGQEAFSDCTALTSFTSNAAEPPVCGDQALDDINKWECTLYVPEDKIDEYKNSEQWKEFFFIEKSGVEDIVVDENENNCLPMQIYTLSGFRVGDSTDNLAPGIYIKRQGNKSEKILIR